MKSKNYAYSFAIGFCSVVMMLLSSCAEDPNIAIQKDAQHLADLRCKLVSFEQQLFDQETSAIKDSLISIQKEIANFQMEIHIAYQTLEDKEVFANAFKSAFETCKPNS